MATMILTHKIALDPTLAQRRYFVKASGVARFAYNWALAEWKRQYEAGLKPREGDLRRELNAIKRTEFPWMLEVTKCAPKQAIMHLGTAFKRFFAKQAQYPQFKRKGKSRDSFRADDGPKSPTSHAVQVIDRCVKLPVVGRVRMRQALRFKGRIISATVSRTADRWFVSLQVEMTRAPLVCDNQATGTVGVDLGVKTLATLSDGTVVEAPRALGRNLQKLQRLTKAHSRKQNGSANRRKSAMKLARLHARIASIRSNSLHHLTHKLVANYKKVVIEDLNVRGMLQNRRLARAVADVGMHEFRRQLGYKAKLHGTEVLTANRWFASSRLCSLCGTKHVSLTLSDRSWSCPQCGSTHDRDLNAAVNLAHLALHHGTARSMSG